MAKLLTIDSYKLDMKEIRRQVSGGHETIALRIKNRDGKYTRTTVTPGKHMTVYELRQLCFSSPNKEFAQEKLRSVERYPEDKVVGVGKDQIALLKGGVKTKQPQSDIIGQQENDETDITPQDEE